MNDLLSAYKAPPSSPIKRILFPTYYFSCSIRSGSKDPAGEQGDSTGGQSSLIDSPR